jgi:hypothetical protein
MEYYLWKLEGSSGNPVLVRHQHGNWEVWKDGKWKYQHGLTEYFHDQDKHFELQELSEAQAKKYMK